VWRSHSDSYSHSHSYSDSGSSLPSRVIVGAGRTSRSAKFATSSELLYLLNLLYNMLIECCDEYKLIQLYQKSSVWCFAFSHTTTFELIPAVATAQPGAMVTVVTRHDLLNRINAATNTYGIRQSQQGLKICNEFCLFSFHRPEHHNRPSLLTIKM